MFFALLLFCRFGSPDPPGLHDSDVYQQCMTFFGFIQVVHSIILYVTKHFYGLMKIHCYNSITLDYLCIASGRVIAT